MLALSGVEGGTIGLRTAGRGDVPTIVALLAADPIGATRDGMASDEDMSPYLDAFAAIDADPAHLLLVAVDGRSVIGTMQLSFLPGMARRGSRRAQIEAVRVSPDHRDRGIGGAMLRWAVGEARRRDCALVQLPSDRARSDAHRFYERLGFVASHDGFKLHLAPG